MKKKIRNEYNSYLIVNFSSSLISRRAIFQVALLFILNLNIAISRDIDNDYSFNYQCLWVVRDALQSKNSIDELINFASEKNINDLFVQVRGRGDALYDSQMIPKSQLLSSDEFDPLSYLLQNIKGKGIKVHAWVNVYLIWSSKVMPQDETHIIYKNEDWIDTTEEWPLDINKHLYRIST
ncbi:MAG TPA: family 10 glycosylhydrolase, partial [SAR86 cluster bacterium]|nr:family 10 glycosylhydrolase [SAR86 cluster bacterium]